MDQTGVLIVNLGTPDTYHPRDVRRYLIEFLTDGRVIDLPWLKRQILVRGIIVPKRYKESSKAYERVWSEAGSPLKHYGISVRDKLQKSLGAQFQVELAMRYQNPSIEKGLEQLKRCKALIILPLFPQYASATTGSVHQKVMEILSRWTTIPKLHFINSYPLQKEMIAAFCDRGKNFQIPFYDHVVFSFHGLPEKHLRKADLSGFCLKDPECCRQVCNHNRDCYSRQCHATAEAIAKGLGVHSDRYTVSFQSRLGKDPWIKPFTLDTLELLLAEGKKRVLVFSPAFVCDCLETIDEIGNEYRREFLSHGGEALDLVPGLNDHPLWIEALKTLVQLHK